MNILHINSYFLKSRFYKGMFEHQVMQGLDIKVYIPIQFNTRTPDFDYGEYSVISKNHFRFDRLIFHLKHNKILKDINERFKQDSFDIVHAHSLFSNGYIAYKLWESKRVPYIVAIRNTDVNVFLKYMIHLRKLGLKIIENSSAVIFLSSGYKEHVISKYIPKDMAERVSRKSLVIPNGLDKFWLENKRNPQNVLNSPIRIITTGLVCNNKNQLSVAKAIDCLNKGTKKYEYFIIGEVNNRGLLKKLSNYSFVNFVTYMKKEELIDFYRKSDLFVMPSYKETFGLSYAEAISQGLPVVYSENQGFDTQFEEGVVGYHVNPHSIESIKMGIIETTRLSFCIDDNFSLNSERFNWITICKDYEKLYIKILSNWR